jgi:hypothetical protein
MIPRRKREVVAFGLGAAGNPVEFTKGTFDKWFYEMN